MTFRRIWFRIDKNMQVIKGSQQLGLLWQQHTISEDITRHVTDTNYREGFGLDVFANFTEMPLDGFPGATGSNAHFLMVIANRATRCIGITQPKAIIDRNTIGNIRKRRRALISCDDQIWIINIPAHNIPWCYDFSTLVVVGDIKQSTHEHFIAGNAFFEERLAATFGGRTFNNKSTFRADRDDHRIFHHLGFHQTENFGAEIFRAIRPAKTTTRDHTTAQMQGFKTRWIDKDFTHRSWQWQFINILAIKFHRQIGFWLTGLDFLIEISSERWIYRI